MLVDCFEAALHTPLLSFSQLSVVTRLKNSFFLIVWCFCNYFSLFYIYYFHIYIVTFYVIIPCCTSFLGSISHYTIFCFCFLIYQLHIPYYIPITSLMVLLILFYFSSMSSSILVLLFIMSSICPNIFNVFF